MTGTTAAASQPQAETLSDSEFKTLLAGVIPHLRAYGRSLSGNPDLADDLTQDTMVKAWASRERFERGTSIKAWTFVILRNTFLSQMRRNKFVGEYDETAVERTMSTPASQEDSGEMADLQRGLMELPQDQREALILVGAGGLSYEEAASICDCAVSARRSSVRRLTRLWRSRAETLSIRSRSRLGFISGSCCPSIGFSPQAASRGNRARVVRKARRDILPERGAGEFGCAMGTIVSCVRGSVGGKGRG